MFRDHQLTVLGLTETWHDTDSPAFGRCRASAYSVVDQPRLPTAPRRPAVCQSWRRCTSCCTRHIIVTAVYWSIVVHFWGRSQLRHNRPFTGGCRRRLPSSFSVSCSSVLRRPVCAARKAGRFECPAVHHRQTPWDVGLRHAEQLRWVFEAFGLQISHTGPTHRDGGVLDLVAARDDVRVSVVNVERSDHSLVHWLIICDQPTTPAVTVHARSWRRLDMDLFRSRRKKKRKKEESLMVKYTSADVYVGTRAT